MDLILLIAFTKLILYLEIALKLFTYSITYTITREWLIWGHYRVHCYIRVVLEYIDQTYFQQKVHIKDYEKKKQKIKNKLKDR